MSGTYSNILFHAVFSTTVGIFGTRRLPAPFSGATPILGLSWGSALLHPRLLTLPASRASGFLGVSSLSLRSGRRNDEGDKCFLLHTFGCRAVNAYQVSEQRHGTLLENNVISLLTES